MVGARGGIFDRGCGLVFFGRRRAGSRPGLHGVRKRRRERRWRCGAHIEQRGFVGDDACNGLPSERIRKLYDDAASSGFRASFGETIHGHFDPGHNTMASLDPEVSFRMTAKGGAFYETSFEGAPGHQKAHTEKNGYRHRLGAKGADVPVLAWRRAVRIAGFVLDEPWTAG